MGTGGVRIHTSQHDQKRPCSCRRKSHFDKSHFPFQAEEVKFMTQISKDPSVVSVKDSFTLVSSSTLTRDPQLLIGKEKRALVSSASLGPQFLSIRFVLAGIPPLGMARDKSATTVIIPSAEHTRERIFNSSVCKIPKPPNTASSY